LEDKAAEEGTALGGGQVVEHIVEQQFRHHQLISTETSPTPYEKNN
jgi:hypothetical protein